MGKWVTSCKQQMFKTVIINLDDIRKCLPIIFVIKSKVKSYAITTLTTQCVGYMQIDTFFNGLVKVSPIK